MRGAWRDASARALYLGKLAVEPARHGRGLARAARAEVEAMARARGCAAVRFESVAAVRNLRPLYEAAGFAVVGELEAADGNGVAHRMLLFEKVL